MSPDIGINSRKYIIKNQNPSSRVQCTSKRNTPLLATAEVDAIGSNVGQLAIFQHLEILLECTDFKHLLVPAMIHRQPEKNVVTNCGILDPRDLGDV